VVTVAKKRTPLAPWVKSLREAADAWTLQIVREAMFGTRKFGAFKKHLGIASNILTVRLAKLVDAGILTRRGIGLLREYQLTEKGHELAPVLAAFGLWSERWQSGPREGSFELVDVRDGSPVQLVPQRADGADVPLEYVRARESTRVKG